MIKYLNNKYHIHWNTFVWNCVVICLHWVWTCLVLWGWNLNNHETLRCLDHAFTVGSKFLNLQTTSAQRLSIIQKKLAAFLVHLYYGLRVLLIKSVYGSQHPPLKYNIKHNVLRNSFVFNWCIRLRQTVEILEAFKFVNADS